MFSMCSELTPRARIPNRCALILRELNQIFIACLFKGSQEQSFFLQTLLFTAFLVTVLKNLTYALVSTRSSVSSRWEHVKRKMHLWFQLRLWWNVCICVLASYSCSNFHEVDMFASSLYFVKVYMFASSLLSLFVLDRVLDLRSVVAPLI